MRKAQADLNVSNSFMIKTDDFKMNAYVKGKVGTSKKKMIPKNEDNIHYSATGQINMGVRFADSYLSHSK